MSLYIGKDTNNKSMLVISKQAQSAAAIKASIPSVNNSFAVDTRRDLLFCETVKTQNPSIRRSYTNSGLTYYVYRVPVSYDFLIAAGSRRFILCYLNGFSYRVNFNLVNESDKSVFGANSYYTGDLFVDIHTLFSSLSDICIVSLRMTENGFSIPYEGSGSRDIKISSDKFLINGIDYFSRRFLVTPPINTDDEIFEFGGKQIQIINSTGSTFTSSVVINNNSIKISNGLKTIINSTSSYFQMFMKDQAPIRNNFNMPGGFNNTVVNIVSINASNKVLGITYYPRVAIYPTMKTYGIVVNDSSTTSIETVYQDVFPVDRGGEIISGFLTVGFYIENGILKASKIVEYDGTPIGVYPDISMRLDYIVVSEQ